MESDDEEPAVVASSSIPAQENPPPISDSDNSNLNTPQCLREKVAFYETVWKRSKVIYPTSHRGDGGGNDSSESSSLEYVQKLDRDGLHLPLRPDYSTQSTSCSSSLASNLTTPNTPSSSTNQFKQTTIKIHCKRTNDDSSISESPAIETKTIKIVRTTPSTPRSVAGTPHGIASPMRDSEWYHDYKVHNFQSTGAKLDHHARSKIEFDIHIKEIRGNSY